MPKITPITISTTSGDVTFNPIGNYGNKTDFVDAAPGAISMKQRLTVKTRPAAVNNAGHVTETVLVSPIKAEVADGCCPTTAAPLVSSFNLRFTRGSTASSAEAEKLYEELVSLVGHADFKALFLGSSFY